METPKVTRNLVLISVILLSPACTRVVRNDIIAGVGNKSEGWSWVQSKSKKLLTRGCDDGAFVDSAPVKICNGEYELENFVGS